MSKFYGQFVQVNEDGTTSTGRVEQYDSYEDMVADPTPGKYGIVKNSNQVYHRNGDNWVIGFPNVAGENEYTAFEVYAHDTDIPVGGLSMTIEEQTFTNAEAIPAGMTHSLSLRTMHPNTSTCDIVIDWGDGTIESVANGDFLETGYEGVGDLTNGERNYSFEHTYAATGKYIVKIYGQHYYNINNGYRVRTDHAPGFGVHVYTNNLMCRCLSDDLPMARNHENLTRFCAGATRLFYLNVDRIKYRYFTQCQNMCNGAVNLVKAVGFKRQFTSAYMNAAFADCHSLVTCDAMLPNRSVYSTATSNMYARCYALAVDVNALIPQGALPDYIEGDDFFATFYDCRALRGPISAQTAKYLWNSTRMSTEIHNGLIGNNRCFEGCSDELRAQVPECFGGTASNDIVE